jgi:DNA-binding NtrC family response regulator
MIVDDELGVLNSLRRLLHNEGYAIFATTSAQEALDRLKSEEISLIICDQRMPQISGVELLKEAKQIRPEAIRIILTGYSDIDVAIQAINEGEVYRFLAKPWNDQELKLIIRKALEHYDLVMDNKILLRMVKRQMETLTELEKRYPGISDISKFKDGTYVIKGMEESLEEFMKRYFPEER